MMLEERVVMRGRVSVTNLAGGVVPGSSLSTGISVKPFFRT
jgi:hypothetical protein